MHRKLMYILIWILCVVNIHTSATLDFQKKYENFVSTLKDSVDIKSSFNTKLKDELAITCKKLSVNPDDFNKWLLNQTTFNYDEKVLRRYLQPKRKIVAKKTNKKNAKNVSKLKNLKRILSFIQKNNNKLNELENEYQVPKEIIASIYSHETRLGTYKLPHILFDVLMSELVFIDEVALMNKKISKKRVTRLKRLARYSLVYLFKYWTKDEIIFSSWAGACGPMQFMPFNFHYLKDGNGDNIVNPSEEFDSIAGAYNFLKIKGWTKSLSKTFKKDEINNKMNKVILRYNSNEEYASGILQTALRLQKLQIK